MGSGRLDARTYYDKFSARYDRGRDRGYHWMLDTLESEVLLPLVEDRDVLELGCGTGLILDRVRGRCRTLVGVDISRGMLERAASRGHVVLQASVDRLPFRSESFDVVFSFKVLAHVPDIEETLGEAHRVLRPGGYLVAEFYNPWSLRAIIKKFGPARRVAEDTHEGHVYTRFDGPGRIRRLLEPAFAVQEFRGIRVLTPWSGLFRLPGATWAMTWAERLAGRTPGLWRFGGFLVVVARKAAERPRRDNGRSGP